MEWCEEFAWETKDGKSVARTIDVEIEPEQEALPQWQYFKTLREPSAVKQAIVLKLSSIDSHGLDLAVARENVLEVVIFPKLTKCKR